MPFASTGSSLDWLSKRTIGKIYRIFVVEILPSLLNVTQSGKQQIIICLSCESVWNFEIYRDCSRQTLRQTISPISRLLPSLIQQRTQDSWLRWNCEQLLAHQRYGLEAVELQRPVLLWRQQTQRLTLQTKLWSVGGKLPGDKEYFNCRSRWALHLLLRYLCSRSVCISSSRYSIW